MPDIEIPVQGDISFHGERPGDVLSAEYDAAAAVSEMPIQEGPLAR